MISIYCTFPDKKSCTTAAHQLLQARQVICANSFPITSIYEWEKEILEEEEYAVFFKTTPDKWESTKSMLSSLHPYEVPAILKFEIEANKSYHEWSEKVLNS